jgi:hypothetical protein
MSIFSLSLIIMLQASHCRVLHQYIPEDMRGHYQDGKLLTRESGLHYPGLSGEDISVI